MESYAGPHAERFAQAFLVDTGQEIVTWTERNPVMANDDWRIDANTGASNDESFILAIATPGGPVGFFAATKADADRIRESMS